MKSTILLATVLMATGAHAATLGECPAGTKLTLSCESTPKAGDHEFVAGLFKTINICQSENDTYASIVSADGTTGAADKVEVITRMGGTSYVLEDSKKVTFTLSIATGTRVPVKKATLTVRFGDANIEGSSTYTCKR